MLYWDLQKCLWDDFCGMAVLEAVQGRYAVIRRFFFLSSIWTLLTVIWQQGTSPSSCLLFIGVHRGVMRREAAGRASATWRILPSPFPQVFCTAFLNPYNFLPHTDITGEEKVMKNTPWSQHCVSWYCSPLKLQTQKSSLHCLHPLCFHVHLLLLRKSLFLQTSQSPDLSPVWQMERQQIYALRDDNFWCIYAHTVLVQAP